jgi:hypothetical protein
MAVLVCDAVVGFHSNYMFGFIHTDNEFQFTDPGVDFWLFLLACASGDLEFIQQRHMLLDKDDSDHFISDRIIGIAIKNDWQNAFHFLLERGYDVNQARPPMMLPNLFTPVIQAVLSCRIEYLEILLEPRFRLCKTGRSSEHALRIIRKHQANPVLREQMIELLISSCRHS